MDNYISIEVGNAMCGASRTSIISVKGYHYYHNLQNTRLWLRCMRLKSALTSYDL